MSKGLEALENIGFEPLYQNEDGSYWRVRDENKEDFDIIEKELKVLDIIRKNIGLHRLSEEFDYLLNIEEYELLKEILQ